MKKKENIMLTELLKVEFKGDGWSPLKRGVFEKMCATSTTIDVGCKQGWWQQSVNKIIGLNRTRMIYKIGIDPIDYNDRQNNGCYDSYFKCAVGLEDHKKTKLYTLNEPGCNSLLTPSRELLNTMYLSSKRTVTDIINVEQRRLDSILKELAQKEIYYLKTDCQGADLSVIKSMGKYLENTQYIEMEVGLDHDKPFYVAADTVEQVLQEMDELGFCPIEFSTFPISPLPEGEIFFERKGLNKC